MPDWPVHLIVPLLALFAGGVVLFYPIYNGMACVYVAYRRWREAR